MVLETERLLLRPWEQRDAERLYFYASDPEVGPIAGWPAHTSVEESKEVIAGPLAGPETYAICLKETGEPIGSISLRFQDDADIAELEDECEMGYWLGRPHWGSGYMSEAVREMERHAFLDLGLARIWIGYYEGNERSRRVQQRCGFLFRWTTKEVEVPQMGEVRTGHVSLLTRERWETLRRGR